MRSVRSALPARLFALLLVVFAGACGEPRVETYVDVAPGELAAAIAARADRHERIGYRVRMRSGVLPANETELEDLCTDWQLYRRRIKRLTRTGDETGVATAQSRLLQTEHWLDAYDPADVEAMKNWVRRR